MHPYENSVSDNSFSTFAFIDPMDTSHPATHVLDRWRSKGGGISYGSPKAVIDVPKAFSWPDFVPPDNIIRFNPPRGCLAFEHLLCKFFNSQSLHSTLCFKHDSEEKYIRTDDLSVKPFNPSIFTKKQTEFWEFLPGFRGKSQNVTFTKVKSPYWIGTSHRWRACILGLVCWFSDIFAMQPQHLLICENSFSDSSLSENSFLQAGSIDPMDTSHLATHVLDRWCSKGGGISYGSPKAVIDVPKAFSWPDFVPPDNIIRFNPPRGCLVFDHLLCKSFNSQSLHSTLCCKHDSEEKYIRTEDLSVKPFNPSIFTKKQTEFWEFLPGFRGKSQNVTFTKVKSPYWIGTSHRWRACILGLVCWFSDIFAMQPQQLLICDNSFSDSSLSENSFLQAGSIDPMDTSHLATHVLDRWCSKGEGIFDGFLRALIDLPKGLFVPTFVLSDDIIHGFLHVSCFVFEHVICKISINLQLLHPSFGFDRIGEAKNPGPRELSIKSCNPTTIANKLEDFREILPGIIGVSETAATTAVQVMMKNQFAEHGLTTKWSAPVSSYSRSSANMRGIAGGTAVLSPFPLRDTCEIHPDDIMASNRVCETHVQFLPNRFMFVASLYGPTDHFKYGDPNLLLNRIFNYTAQRACRFVGPAVIMGDLNAPLSRLDLWPSLQAQGWIDAGEISALNNGHPLEMTYFEASRHTFILVNPFLSKALIQCRTTAHHLFAGHPVLDARFDIDTIISPAQVWQLPKSFDQFLHDPDVAEYVANQLSLQHQSQVLEALVNHDVDKLSRIWTSIAEQTLVKSAITVDGQQQYIKPGHLGRAHKRFFKTTQMNVPICKKARSGDYQPMMDQCSVELRRCTKQLHRLQSLCRQLIGLHRSFNFRALQQAQHLWETILDAKGFHGGFSSWIFCHLETEVTRTLPPMGQLEVLKDCFAEWHAANDKKAWLAKTNIKQLDIVFDLAKGGKLAFQQVKTAPLPPVTQLVQTKSFPVRRTAWSKEGVKVLFGGPFREIDPNLPVSFQSQVVCVEKLTDSTITLDKPVKLRSASQDDFQIRQEKILVEPPALHRSLCDAWNSFFQRDDPQNIDQLEEKEQRLLSKITPANVMELPPISGELIKNAVNSTKISSSRGSDGFSTLDLRKLPIALFNMLAILFQHIELHGVWPERWTLAKTICLPKCSQAKSPYDIRPVTVMAKMYRIWGKIRGKQVAKILAATIPPEIGGPCKGVAADMIALWTSHKIERSFMEQQALSGVVIDIIKCYNTVPRGMLLRLLGRLGVPAEVIQAFRGMMIQMQRFFELVQTCSDLHATTTGIIEGCGFAIPSMLSLGILAFRVLLDEAPSCECAFFADNWSLFANDPHQLIQGFEVLQKIVSDLSMKIAPTKSWCWATDSESRKALRALSVDNKMIPMVFEAKDLGVQQCYSLKKCKKVLTQRIGKAKSKLSVVKKAKVPRGSKKRLALGAGLSTTAYGSAFSSIAPKDVHTLRVKVSQAVSRSGSGANSYLACNVVDTNLDPELRFLVQRFQLWRRFIRTFPSQKQFALENMFALQDIPCINRKMGSLHAFVASIVMLGGKVDTQGKICLADQNFVWFDVSSKFLIFAIHRSWVRHVATQRIERKHFDINDFDAKGCSTAFGKLAPKDKAFVDSYITGRHCTNEILSKYIPTIASKCSLCQAEDSRHHRLFECPALAKFRQGKPALKRAMNWPEANWYFGLCPAIEDIPDRLRLIDGNFPLTIPEECNSHEYVFTDGTAFFTNVQQYTVSASAFVVADFGKFDIKHSGSSVVPGLEQNSFLAELFAVRLVLNTYFNAHIFTDCQAVCDLLKLAINGESIQQELGSQSIELWRCLHTHLNARPLGAITVAKVKAHVDHKHVRDPILKWQTWANNCVDSIAKNVFLVQHRVLHSKVEKLYNKALRNRKDIYELYCFWALATNKCIQAEISQGKHQKVTNQFDSSLPSLAFATGGQSLVLNLSREQFLGFPWGPVYLWRISQWAMQLVWPTEGTNHGRDISFVELYIDFMLWSGTRAPRNIFSAAQRDRYGFSNFVLDDIDTLADAGPLDLFQQNDVWGRSLTWLHKFLPEGLFPANFLRRSLSLRDLGCSAWYRGFDKRPALTHRFEAAEILHRYFVTSTGTHRNMKRHLELNLKSPGPHPSWLDIDFISRLPLMRRSKVLFEGTAV